MNALGLYRMKFDYRRQTADDARWSVVCRLRTKYIRRLNLISALKLYALNTTSSRLNIQMEKAIATAAYTMDETNIIESDPT